MSESSTKSRAWTQQSERGSLFLMRLIVWLGFVLGRRFAGLILYPISLYFWIVAVESRRASINYLRRVYGRPPNWKDSLAHIHTFACVLLDRIYFLNDSTDLFEIHMEGEALMQQSLKTNEGVFLLGAHMGSFDALRAMGHRYGGHPLVLLMHQNNAKKIQQVLAAIDPARSHEIIALGEVDTLLKVEQKLREGGVIGILADRTLGDLPKDIVRLPFLGEEAPFSIKPFRLAFVLRKPVFLMLGLRRGGNTYDVIFEKIADFSQPLESRSAAISQAMALYVQRLEHYCKTHPDNWFNFFDFWNATDE